MSQEGPSPGAEEIVARHGRLVRRTFLVSFLTLLSRILGLVREAGTSALFGDSSAVGDALVTAWRVPNLFRRLLGEGALSTSLQTAMTESDHARGREGGRALFAATLRLSAVVLVGVCAAVMGAVVLLPDHMPFTDWAWLGSEPAAVRELVLRLMPYVVLVCLSAQIGGALQVRGEFLVSTLAPIVLNLVWVGTLGGLWWRDRGGPADGTGQELVWARTLSWATLAAGLLQIAIQLPTLARQGLWILGAARVAFAETWAVFRDSAPLALGAAVYQVNVTVDGLMAQGLLPEGGPMAFNNATRIQQFPMGLVAVAATSAVFPSLKALGHLRRLGELRKLHDQAQLAVCFVAIPASLGLLALAGPISEVLFLHGKYGADGVERVAAALRVLALVVLPAGAQGLLARAYYALGDFRTPVRVSVAVMLLNIPLNALFVVGFGMQEEGLALATVLTTWCSVLWLAPGLKRRLGLPGAEPGLGGRLVRMGIASAASCAAAGLVHGPLLGLLGGQGRGAPAAALLGAILVALGLYAGLGQLLGIPEWRQVLARLRSRSR